MKTLPALSIVVSSAILVAACSSGGGSNNPTPTPTPTSTPTLTPTPTATPTARPNFALQFDGVDDTTTIPSAGFLDATTTFTLEAWVKPADVTAGPLTGIVMGQINAGGLAFGLFQGTDKTKCGMLVSVPGTSSASSPTGTLFAGVWHHLAGTFDGTNIRMYIDGVLISTVANPGTMVASDSLLIGGAFTLPFNGTIDEVRVWRIARTQLQIAQFMGQRLNGDEPGLVGYWNLDENAGQLLFDQTPFDNIGELGTTTAAEATDPTFVVSDAPITP